MVIDYDFFPLVEEGINISDFEFYTMGLRVFVFLVLSLSLFSSIPFWNGLEEFEYIALEEHDRKVKVILL